MIHRKHSRHHRKQNLRGANVAGGLIPTDVLFPGLQRETVGRIAIGIFGDADQATGHLALEAAAHGQVASVRSAKAERNSEALGCSHRNVCAHLPGRHQKGHGEKVRRDDSQRLVAMKGFDSGARVGNFSRGARVLDKATKTLGDFAGEVGFDNLNTERFRASAHNGFGLLQGVRIKQENVAGLRGRSFGDEHGFRHRGGLIQHGCVRCAHPGQVRNHRLEVQECFESSLRDFWLVRGVGGVPTGVFQHVAFDHRGCVRSVIPLTDERAADGVGIGKRAQLREGFSFTRCSGNRRARDVFHPEVTGNSGLHESRKGVKPQRIQHQCLRGSIGADVSMSETGHVLTLQSTPYRRRHQGHRAAA